MNTSSSLSRCRRCRVSGQRNVLHTVVYTPGKQSWKVNIWVAGRQDNPSSPRRDESNAHVSQNAGCDSLCILSPVTPTDGRVTLMHPLEKKTLSPRRLQGRRSHARHHLRQRFRRQHPRCVRFHLHLRPRPCCRCPCRCPCRWPGGPCCLRSPTANHQEDLLRWGYLARQRHRPLGSHPIHTRDNQRQLFRVRCRCPLGPTPVSKTRLRAGKRSAAERVAPHLLSCGGGALQKLGEGVSKPEISVSRAAVTTSAGLQWPLDKLAMKAGYINAERRNDALAVSRSKVKAASGPREVPREDRNDTNRAALLPFSRTTRSIALVLAWLGELGIFGSIS